MRATRDDLLLAKIALLESERERNLRIAEKNDVETKMLNRRLRDENASSNEAQVYYFHGPVSPITSADCVELLAMWARKNPGSDMTVVFNSPGGSVFEGLALYDSIQDIRARGHHVTTKSIGMAASMGGVLLQAGDERVMGQNGFMLIHEVSGGNMGKASELEDVLKFMGRLQDKCCGILASRSTLSVAQIKRRWKKTDWWLDSEEALRYGFIDRIEE
jgi:ATP-dependent Clp endopeptidase proteolytic subunit ClpP